MSLFRKKKSIMPSSTFFYAAAFAALGRGLSDIKTIQIENGASFEVMAIHASVNLNVAVAAAAPKLARDGDTTYAGATNASLSHVRIMVKQNDRSWMSEPIRLDTIAGEPGKPFFLPVPILVPGNTALSITLYNDVPANIGGIAAASIDAQIVLVGTKIQAG